MGGVLFRVRVLVLTHRSSVSCLLVFCPRCSICSFVLCVFFVQSVEGGGQEGSSIAEILSLTLCVCVCEGEGWGKLTFA